MVVLHTIRMYMLTLSSVPIRSMLKILCSSILYKCVYNGSRHSRFAMFDYWAFTVMLNVFSHRVIVKLPVILHQICKKVTQANYYDQFHPHFRSSDHHNTNFSRSTNCYVRLAFDRLPKQVRMKIDCAPLLP